MTFLSPGDELDDMEQEDDDELVATGMHVLGEDDEDEELEAAADALLEDDEADAVVAAVTDESPEEAEPLNGLAELEKMEEDYLKGEAEEEDEEEEEI